MTRRRCWELWYDPPATGQANMRVDVPAKFIIHTVGPVWHGGTQDEAKLLASCYRESLSLAAAQGLSTIAFPCISTGVYGYPPEQACEVAVAAARDFMRSPGSLREVIFCCFSEGDMALYQSVLAHQTGN